MTETEKFWKENNIDVSSMTNEEYVAYCRKFKNEYNKILEKELREKYEKFNYKDDFSFEDFAILEMFGNIKI